MTNRYHIPLSVRIAFATALIFWAAINAIFPGQLWHQPSRQPGQPLSGYWRLAAEKGCYRNSQIYNFGDRTMKILNYPTVEDLGNYSLELISDHKIQINFRQQNLNSSENSALVFIDHGDKLELVRASAHGVPTTLPENTSNAKREFVNCGSYDFIARAMLILKRPFNPRDFDLK